MNVGLFFGTFNPIHIGHLIIANHLTEFSDLHQVWFIVSPQSPFKQKTELLADNHRLKLVNIAIEKYPNLKASNIEFKMPKPNYTIDTLILISKKYPEHNLSIIMGDDNLETFNKWKNYKTILSHYQLYVYPRIYQKMKINSMFDNHKKIVKVNAPIIEISATFIRKAIKDNKNISTLLPCKVWKYINKMGFYKK